MNDSSNDMRVAVPTGSTSQNEADADRRIPVMWPVTAWTTLVVAIGSAVAVAGLMPALAMWIFGVAKGSFELWLLLAAAVVIAVPLATVIWVRWKRAMESDFRRRASGVHTDIEMEAGSR